VSPTENTSTRAGRSNTVGKLDQSFIKEREEKILREKEKKDLEMDSELKREQQKQHWAKKEAERKLREEVARKNRNEARIAVAAERERKLLEARKKKEEEARLTAADINRRREQDRIDESSRLKARAELEKIFGKKKISEEAEQIFREEQEKELKTTQPLNENITCARARERIANQIKAGIKNPKLLLPLNISNQKQNLKVASFIKLQKLELNQSF